MCLPSKPDIPEIKAPEPLPEPTPLPGTAPPPGPPTLPPPPTPQSVTPAPAPPLPPIPVSAPAPQITGDNLDDSGKVKTLKSKRAQLQQQGKASGTRIKKKKKTDQLAIDKGGLGAQATSPGTVNIQK